MDRRTLRILDRLARKKDIDFDELSEDEKKALRQLRRETSLSMRSRGRQGRLSRPRRTGASLGWALSDIAQMGRILEAFERQERNKKAGLRIPASKLDDFLDRDEAPTTKEAYEIVYGDERDAPGGHTRGEFIMILDEEARWESNRAEEYERRPREAAMSDVERGFTQAVAVVRRVRPDIADELGDRLRRGMLRTQEMPVARHGETSTYLKKPSSRYTWINDAEIRYAIEHHEAMLWVASTLYHEQLHARARGETGGRTKAHAAIYFKQMKFLAELMPARPDEASRLMAYIEELAIEAQGKDSAFHDNVIKPWLDTFRKTYRSQYKRKQRILLDNE